MNPANVSAILLAGGYSSRMGCDKAELLFCGKSLVQYQAERLCSIGAGEILLSGYGKSIPKTRLIPDEVAHRGPLSGIHAGLKAARFETALVIAVDTPLVPNALLIELIKTHQSGVTIVSHGGEWEPLIGVYDKALAPVCQEVLSGKNSSLRSLFQKTQLHFLEYTADARLLMNCNTPEDYAALLAYEERCRGMDLQVRYPTVIGSDPQNL